MRRKPVNRVVLQGTRKEPLPADPRTAIPTTAAASLIAYDVDCAGGSGDGPGYVSGPVRVIGSDIYDLDRDGDGWGCDCKKRGRPSTRPAGASFWGAWNR